MAHSDCEKCYDRLDYIIAGENCSLLRCCVQVRQVRQVTLASRDHVELLHAGILPKMPTLLGLLLLALLQLQLQARDQN